MQELDKFDLLVVKIAPQIKIHARPESMEAILENAVFWGFSPQNREGHRSYFLRSPSKLPEPTKKLSFHENGHGTIMNK